MTTGLQNTVIGYRAGDSMTDADNNTVIGYHPEYEDCKNLAKIHNIPLKVIFDQAIDQSKKMPR